MTTIKNSINKKEKEKVIQHILLRFSNYPHGNTFNLTYTDEILKFYSHHYLLMSEGAIQT